MIGILGGMGPAATADFYLKVIEETRAERDEDHVPLLIQSDPRIPRRPPAILSGRESPLPALLASRDRLIAAGAVALAMPCNSAHYWYAQLVADCPVPFLSIVDASCDELAALAPAGSRIGLIATRGTVAGRVFDAPLIERSHVPLHCTDDELDAVVLPAIEHVKFGRAHDAGRLLEPVVEALLNEALRPSFSLAPKCRSRSMRWRHRCVRVASIRTARWRVPACGCGHNCKARNFEFARATDVPAITQEPADRGSNSMSRSRRHIV